MPHDHQPITSPKAIALATCKHHPGFVANDDAPVQAALEARGIDAPLLEWDDDSIDWSAFDAVVIRTTWDYMDRPDEFLAWADRVNANVPLLNPPDLVRWNLNKTYLRDLSNAGIRTVPTRWVEPTENPEQALATILEQTNWTELIIKPAIGAGASGLLRTSDPAQAAAHIAELQTNPALKAAPTMVQPWLPSILERGETSFVMFDSPEGPTIHHAVRKTPKEGDFRVQIEFGGRYTQVAPTIADVTIACQAWDAAKQHADPLYARIDVVEVEPGVPYIIELECVEPELFFPMVEAAPDIFIHRLLWRLEGNIGPEAFDVSGFKSVKPKKRKRFGIF